jgi:hypothetical protein
VSNTSVVQKVVGLKGTMNRGGMTDERINYLVEGMGPARRVLK